MGMMKGWERRGGIWQECQVPIGGKWWLCCASIGVFDETSELSGCIWILRMRGKERRQKGCWTPCGCILYILYISYPE